MRLLTLLFSITFLTISNLKIEAQRMLSLEECITIAQKNSLDIKRAFLSEKNADIAVKYAKHQFFPSLNTNSSLSYNLGRRINPTTNSYVSESFLSQSININSGIVLYSGNKIRNSIKKAIIDKKASQEDINQMKRDIALLVTNNYLSILFAEENKKNAQKQYDLTNDQLEKIEKMIKAGIKPKSASLNLEAQLLSDKQKVIISKSDIEKFYLNLKNLLLIPSSENISIKTPNIDMIQTSKAELIPLEQIMLGALKHYPGYNAAELKVKSKKMQEKISFAALLPTVSIGGGLSTNYSNRAVEVIGYENNIRNNVFIINNKEVPVGIPYKEPILKDQPYFDQIKNNVGFGMALQVNIPIYNNYASRAMIQRAKIDVEASEIDKDLVIQNLKSKIQIAIADAKSSRLQYLASLKTYDAQKSAFKNAKLQNELGAISTYDFLNSKLLFEKAENNLLISKYQNLFKVKILEYYQGENLTFENK